MTIAAEPQVEGCVFCGDDRIHYVERGHGQPILLIHGAFGSGSQFLATEFGSNLARHGRVIAPDSLAHGLSSAPVDQPRYSARMRAHHLASVLDSLGIERAHIVGYSMGGWMASAFATHFPARLASLTIGGWDVVSGMYTPAAAWGLAEINYDILSGLVRRDRPELLSWLETANEPALAAAINAMNDLAGLAEGVVRCGVPVEIWVGESDLYHPPCKLFAAAHGFPLISLPGDHISTLEQHGALAAQKVIAFIESASSATPGPASLRSRT